MGEHTRKPQQRNKSRTALPGLHAMLRMEDVFGPVETAVVHCDAMSTDGRRLKCRAMEAAVPSALKQHKFEDSGQFHPVASGSGSGRVDSHLSELLKLTIHGFQNEPIKEVEESTQMSAAEIQVDMAEIITRTRRKRYQTLDEPMRQWAPYRNEYLAEMLRAEGRGDRNKNFCYACGCLDREHAPVFCCISGYFSKDLVCEECCRKHHWNRPLDIVEVHIQKCASSLFTDIGLDLAVEWIIL
ncbi:hypothetical protein BT96DRAFT_1003594 [Gymnopus androsaceus JB14]|uniref:Uncharacterized protein n=1 Tax=Gymnopus androsaceus JB14 TaxID=1447944 RepID=A0A6A4GUJ7_9AGAR|nr:hypothetical protein BT96DRAFT_1003594 [Gymnopus androsaceus JB14]